MHIYTHKHKRNPKKLHIWKENIGKRPLNMVNKPNDVVLEKVIFFFEIECQFQKLLG